jgi:enoyl-CoA hydratase
MPDRGARPGLRCQTPPRGAPESQVGPWRMGGAPHRISCRVACSTERGIPTSGTSPEPGTSPMSESGSLRIEVLDGIATLTIDRPEKLNALDAGVIDELDDTFAQLGRDEGLRGVIVTGAGEKAFVAGADIRVLSDLDPIGARALSRRGQEVFRRIETFPRPVIAAVGGYALGGGCELAMACHLRVASDDARFGLPEVGLGTIPGYGGTVRLTRLVGQGRALEMILTGDPVGAVEAERIGLVNRVVTRERLMEEARHLLLRITRNGPVAVRSALEAVYAGLETPAPEAERMEAALFAMLAATGDMREGTAAFLEKRKPEFKGR